MRLTLTPLLAGCLYVGVCMGSSAADLQHQKCVYYSAFLVRLLMSRALWTARYFCIPIQTLTT